MSKTFEDDFPTELSYLNTSQSNSPSKTEEEFCLANINQKHNEKEICNFKKMRFLKIGSISFDLHGIQIVSDGPEINSTSIPSMENAFLDDSRTIERKSQSLRDIKKKCDNAHHRKFSRGISDSGRY